MKKIVATSWHPGGANAISPVIKALIQEGKTKVVVIGYQFSEKIFQNNGISYRTIESYGLKDVSVDSMEELLAVELPDLILTGTSAQDEKNRNVIEQTIALAAKRVGIKSLAILDFWANYSLRFNDVFTGEKFKFLPDKIAIMDEIAKETMINEGFDKTRLVITGNPDFDNLENMARNFKEKKIIRAKIGSKADLLIFYAANAWKKEIDELGFWDLDNIKIVNRVFQSLSEDRKAKVDMVVKLHPRVPREDFLEISQYIDQDSKGRIKLVSDIDPLDLILASDLTLTPFSTLGIKAVYMRKPCISLQPGLKGKDLLIVSEKGFIPVGYTADDCEREFKKAILNDKYRQEELPRKAAGFRTDGKATESVKKLVYRML